MGPPGPRLGSALKLLHRKSGQNAVLSMTNTTDVSRVYQTANRADDRTDRTKRLVSLVTIFQQNYPTTTTTVSFHCQPLTGGDTGSRVFLWWAADRAAIHPALMGSAFVLVSTSGAYGIFMLRFLHTMDLIYQSCKGTCADLNAGKMVRKGDCVICTNCVCGQSKWMTGLDQWGVLKSLWMININNYTLFGSIKNWC